jgi:hypothetical protein
MMDQKRLKELFDYREDGHLIWKVEPYLQSRFNVGDIVGSIRSHGYRMLFIKGIEYRVHRLIFLYHHGYLPKYLDHKDNDRSNNRIDNLRPSTLSGNNRNTSSRKDSTSKYLGVYWNKASNKWATTIRIDGKPKHLGVFVNEQVAALVYDNAAKEHFGEWANLNFK